MTEKENRFEYLGDSSFCHHSDVVGRCEGREYVPLSEKHHFFPLVRTLCERGENKTGAKEESCFLEEPSEFSFEGDDGFVCTSVISPKPRTTTRNTFRERITQGPMADTCQGLWTWKTYFILLFTPIVLCPLPAVVGSSEAKCGYVIVIMAVYWVTESLPISVTAFLPVVLFPLFEILDSNDVAGKYVNDVIMLFTGGLMLAIAVEYWNLHKRIALRILLFVGVEPRWLMLGMMLATWFLSMWISNTATTAMMMPIMEAILVQLKDKGDYKELENDSKKNNGLSDGSSKAQKNSVNHDTIELSVKGDGEYFEQRKRDERTARERKEQYIRMTKGLSLSICYAANCGGIASLTGTGPNLVLKSTIDDLYEGIGKTSPVSFGSWMAFGLPLSVVVLVLCWLWLNLAFLRCSGMCRCRKISSEQSRRVRKVIQDEYDGLGPMVFGQAFVLGLFVLLVFLWITRDMGGVAGWGSWFGIKIKDGTPAMLIGCLLFALPSTLPCIKSYPNYSHPALSSCAQDVTNPNEKVVIRPLLNWKIVHEKFPWNLLFLLGGGFAISGGSEASGLSRWVAIQLEFFDDWNKWAILFIFCYITAATTEVTSNTAIATILMPIMVQLALSTGIHPLYYMFPTALACSFAYMLPVATPPNAIVFTYGRVTVPDMMKSGIVLNILVVPILIALIGTLGDAIFDFDDIPHQLFNATTTSAPSVTNI